MIYKPGMSAEKRWRRIRGFSHLAKVIEGVKFRDGVEIEVNSKTDNSRNAACSGHTPDLTIARDISISF